MEAHRWNGPRTDVPPASLRAGPGPYTPMSLCCMGRSSGRHGYGVAYLGPAQKHTCTTLSKKKKSFPSIPHPLGRSCPAAPRHARPASLRLRQVLAAAARGAQPLPRRRAADAPRLRPAAPRPLAAAPSWPAPSPSSQPTGPSQATPGCPLRPCPSPHLVRTRYPLLSPAFSLVSPPNPSFTDT